MARGRFDFSTEQWRRPEACARGRPAEHVDAWIKALQRCCPQGGMRSGVPALQPLVQLRLSTAVRAQVLSAETKQLCRAAAPLLLQRLCSALPAPSVSPERMQREVSWLLRNEPVKLQSHSFQCTEGVCTRSCSLFVLSRERARRVRFLKFFVHLGVCRQYPGTRVPGTGRAYSGSYSRRPFHPSQGPRAR